MKGFYKRRADGELADMPPCGLCKHKNKQTYPADQSFDLDLCGGNWKLSESDEFAGYSHERITMEVYQK